MLSPELVGKVYYSEKHTARTSIATDNVLFLLQSKFFHCVACAAGTYFQTIESKQRSFKGNRFTNSGFP